MAGGGLYKCVKCKIKIPSDDVPKYHAEFGGCKFCKAPFPGYASKVEELPTDDEGDDDSTLTSAAAVEAPSQFARHRKNAAKRSDNTLGDDVDEGGKRAGGKRSQPTEPVVVAASWVARLLPLFLALVSAMLFLLYLLGEF